MKTSLTFAGLLALSITPSHAALVYAMHFENQDTGSLDVDDTVNTSSASGHTGSATVVGDGSSIDSVGVVNTAFCGPVDMGQVLNVADDSYLNSGVDLGPSGGAASLGIDSQSPYTMAAWVNQPVPTGDGFWFGTLAGNALHLGTRGTGYHSGHWNDDVSGLGTAVNNAWTYVVFTNDAAGTQEVFVDGVSVGSGAGNNGNFRNFDNFFTIGGTRDDGNSDFVGQIAGLRIYDEVLSANQQKSIAGLVAIPEPSRPMLIASAFVGLMLRRRRR